MPPARRGRSPISLIFLAALAAACVPPAPPLTEAERETAVRLGGEAADRLAGTLIQHLTAAIDSAGPAGAIEFCAGRAMPITEDVNRQLGTLQVKRTSTRLRNPANAPDSLERVALAWFESELERTGAPPDAWVQEAGRTSVRYYRPLVANDMCVRCHGPVESLAEEVRARLRERYPEDQATGYLTGDLRGLIRVSIPRASLEP